MTSQATSISITTTAATVVSLIVIMGAFWTFGQPWLVQTMSVAMADDIEHKIEKQVTPMREAFKIFVRRDIDDMRRRASQMEYRRDNPPSGDWTQEDARDLENLRLDIEAAEDALEELYDE